MPKLSYPATGRVASARSKEDLVGDKSNSIKLVDQEGDQHPELEKPEVKIEPEQDDVSLALQKQIEALRKSEQTQKERNEQLTREREEAIKRANERELEIHKLKNTTIESRLGEVSSALSAATAEAESAQHDLEKAIEIGDLKGQAEAYRKMARAENRISTLEDGKVELEAEVKAALEAPKPQVSNDPLENSSLPPIAKDYLRLHPELLTNKRKNARIQDLHYVITEDEGIPEYSRDYFKSMDVHMGYADPPEKNEQEDEPRKSASNFSAPVSREAPTGSTERNDRVTLSVAQKEAAKIAGITEKEYAENVLRLRKEKSNGHYGGQQ